MIIQNASWGRRVLIVSVALLGSSAWAQQKVYIGYCEGADVDDRTRSAICELMKSEVEGEGYSVVLTSDGADFSLRSSTLVLGSSLITTVTKTQGQRTLKSNRLKASSVEELDQVIPRLVRATVAEKDLGGDTRIGEVTEAEANFRSRRKESRIQHTYGLGFSSAPELGTGLMYDLVLGWGVDWTQFRFKVDWDLALSTHGFDAFFGTIGGGGVFYLSDHESSPYLAFKVGVAMAKGPEGSLLDSTRTGPLGGLAIGFEGFRNHNATGFIQLKMDMQLSSSDTHGMPVLWGLQGGINY